MKRREAAVRLFDPLSVRDSSARWWSTGCGSPDAAPDPLPDPHAATDAEIRRRQRTRSIVTALHARSRLVVAVLRDHASPRCCSGRRGQGMGISRNLRTGLISGAVACGDGRRSASPRVPLYRIFCQQTGFGGTARIEAGAQAPGCHGQDRHRPLRHQCQPQAAAGASRPSRRLSAWRSARASSPSSTPPTSPTSRSPASAAFNVSPDQARAYFVKIQCFCFTEQTLTPGETQRMPVVFYVDPTILKDPDNAGRQRNHAFIHILPGGPAG